MTLDFRGDRAKDDDDPDIRFIRELEERFPSLVRKGSGRYILNAQGEPEECDDLITWALWMEKNHLNRHVCHDMDEGEGDDKIRVSTVFLGVDYRHWGEGPPILWETMVFGGPLDGHQRRYTSRDDAFKGHQLICQQVSAAYPKPPHADPPDS